MEFMNVGGGELLIIILLALVLFSPEDILKLMRTIGKYARTARQMWSNVSRSLQEDYMPDEVKEVVKETASSVKEARTTLTSVREQFNDLSSSIEEEVGEASDLADSKVSEAVNTVNATVESDSDSETNLSGDTEITGENNDTFTTAEGDSDEESILPPDTMGTSEEIASRPSEQPQSDIKAVITPDQDTLPDNDLDITFSIDEQPIKELDVEAPLTKEFSEKTQGLKSSVSAPSVNAKLAKVAEDTLKDDGNDS